MPKRKLVTVDAFRSSAQVSEQMLRDLAGAGELAVMRASLGRPKAVGGDEARTLRWCFSDGSIDRAGDTINPEGWDLRDFLNNPVSLWAHDSWSPPIGRAANVGPEGKRLMGDITFALAEEYAFADTIYRLAKGGFISACSVGFIPHEWVFTSDKDRPYGIDFTKQELLEISPCPVPCNANALVEARSQGIDTAPLREWAEKMLDDGQGFVLVPRSELEQLRKAADPKARVTRKPAAPAKSDTSKWQCGADRELPVDDGDSWDGDAAKERVFAWAGFDGDNPDSEKARRAFLAWDSATPALKGSYKDPFADVVDGTLKAIAGGIRAAASRLPQSDLPQDVIDEARKVLDAYEGRLNDGKSSADEPMPVGTCGRPADEPCGMVDPAECSIHAPKPDKSKTATKAGRVLSAENESALRQAAELIEGVLNQLEPGSGDDSEPDADDAKTAAQLRRERALAIIADL